VRQQLGLARRRKTRLEAQRVVNQRHDRRSETANGRGGHGSVSEPIDQQHLTRGHGGELLHRGLDVGGRRRWKRAGQGNMGSLHAQRREQGEHPPVVGIATGRQTVSFPVSPWIRGKTISAEMTVDATFVPSKLGINSDSRQLGVVFHGISFLVTQMAHLTTSSIALRPRIKCVQRLNTRR